MICSRVELLEMLPIGRWVTQEVEIRERKRLLPTMICGRKKPGN